MVRGAVSANNLCFLGWRFVACRADCVPFVRRWLVGMLWREPRSGDAASIFLARCKSGCFVAAVAKSGFAATVAKSFPLAFVMCVRWLLGLVTRHGCAASTSLRRCLRWRLECFPLAFSFCFRWLPWIVIRSSCAAFAGCLCLALIFGLCFRLLCWLDMRSGCAARTSFGPCRWWRLESFKAADFPFG